MSGTQNAAGSRIASLLDANSFVEIGAQVTARSTDFNLTAAKAPSDGVITGYGTIDGSLVYIYSQDVSVLNGTIGEMHARKITGLYRLAMKTGAPVIGLLDSGGVRLEESTDALNALGSVYRCQAMASGVIPQITAVYGNCGGGLSIVPALSDFVFMESSKGSLYVNAPDAIPGNSTDKVDNTSPEYQMKAGNIDFAGTESEIASAIRTLVTLLPLNNEDDGEIAGTNDDLNRDCGSLSAEAANAADVLKIIGDNGVFFETKSGCEPDLVTGFIRLDGMTVGAVAAGGTEGKLRVRGLEKAASFIRFCDSFNIPVLTLAQGTGFHACVRGEKRMAGAAASLAYAYAEATVPKVTVVTGKLFGSAYMLLGSKALGADMVFAWPNAEIGAMEAPMAAKILAGGSDAAGLKKTEADYRALQLSVNEAAARGYVDTVIADGETRKYVIGAFEMLCTKREDRPDKKHGTV